MTFSEETELPSFPASTSVEQKKSPTSLSPIPGEMAKSISDPKSIEAIRSLLIQGGIPINQGGVSNTVIPPITQYSGTAISRVNQGGTSYKVKKGDTLDGVIRSILSTHPFKIRKVRQTIINLNRQAFPTGKPTSMQAGAILMIPSLNALRAELTGGMAYGVNPFEEKDTAEKKVYKDPHDGWVRFP
tara:strand:+ start:412 stop:972 length:561 start_codon:yes stop_codon:yes gene_type:complete